MLEELGIDALGIIGALIVPNKFLPSVGEQCADKNIIHEALMFVKQVDVVATSGCILGV